MTIAGREATALYKVGITKFSIRERYRAEDKNEHIRTLGLWTFPIRSAAAKAEAAIRKEFRYHLLEFRLGRKVRILSNGNSEIFLSDIWKCQVVVEGHRLPGKFMFERWVDCYGGRRTND